MTLNPFLCSRAPMATLALLCIVSGCDDTVEPLPRDQGSVVIDEGLPSICVPTGSASRYRVTTLHIPTRDEATANAVLGSQRGRRRGHLRRARLRRRRGQLPDRPRGGPPGAGAR
jgi:hypothetical protein